MASGRVVLGEILDARPRVGDHRVEVVGGALDRGNRLAQILGGGLALLVDQPVGAVGQHADALGGDAGVARGDPRIADGVGEVGRALGEDVGGRLDILEDVGDRILVLVAEQFGQPLGQPLDAVDQLRRAVEQGAEAARASTG